MLVSKNKFAVFFLTALSLLLMAVFLLPGFAIAQSPDIGIEYAADIGLTEPEQKDVRIFIVEVVRYFITFLGIIAVSMVMYSGFLWMTSGGDPTKVEKAKRTLLNSVIGLIIIISAFAIVSFIINFMENAGSGGRTRGSGGVNIGGLSAFGACAIESVYPEPYQDNVPRNTSIVVTFVEEIDENSIISAGKMIDDGRIKIYQKGDENGYLRDVNAFNAGGANRTYVFQPVEYLGSPSENTVYYVYLSNDIKTVNGKGVFDNCGVDKYAEWQFTVSNKIDLTPPQVKAGGVFPAPDNWQDGKTTVSAAQASGEMQVSGAPAEKRYASFGNPTGSKNAVLENKNLYSTVSGNLLIAVSSDGLSLRMENTSTGVALGTAAINGREAVFVNFFKLVIAEGETYSAGDSWTVVAGAYSAGDTLTVGTKTYAFGPDGEIAVGATTAATAQNIVNVLNAHPEVSASLSGTTITVNARIAGTAGNNVVLNSSNPEAITITAAMSGGTAAGETVQVIGRQDRPRNSVIQINFNEAINPLSVSGSALELKDKVLVQCVAGCSVDGVNFFACDADKDGAENEVCVNGKFALSSQYRTLEFISDNLCGVNGCGEKIYCLPADSNLRVVLFAAGLANCSSGEISCATKPPYTSCIGGICRNSADENYPLSSLSPLSGIADMSFNSLDGDRDRNAEGPQRQSGTPPYNENEVLGLCAGGANNGKICTDLNKESVCGLGISCQNSGTSVLDIESLQGVRGDDYLWSFYIGSMIKSGAPLITSVSPAHGSGNVRLNEPQRIKFDGLMMNGSLGTGQVTVFDGTKNLIHKRINLRSLANRVVGYWTVSENIDNPADLDGEADWTEVEIRHSLFPEYVSFRAQVGSGVKDIYQNCFKPSSGPLCTANDYNPNCCPAGAAISPIDGSGLDNKGNCK